ncbi:MAG: hypothetical protein HFH60_07495 [Lachnospiraceae bacterium]|nr:hypothetical protein [Lachnospiraceae bacterium]
MGVFAGCIDARNMVSIYEEYCPRCKEECVIEVFERDGQTVGESSCDVCGFSIPEGVKLKEYMEGRKKCLTNARSGEDSHFFIEDSC